MNPAYLPSLLAALRDENPPARARAARRLVELAEPSRRWNGPPEETPAPDPQAVKALALLLLEETDADVFSDATSSRNARDLLPADLAQAWVDHKDDFRRAFAYREWERRSRTAADLIARSERAARALVEDKSPVVRAEACSALRCHQQLWLLAENKIPLQEEDWRRLRAQAFEVWPELVRELADAPRSWARSYAAEALNEWDINEPEVIAALTERAECETNEHVLKDVKSTLRRLKATRAPLFRAWSQAVGFFVYAHTGSLKLERTELKVRFRGPQAWHFAAAFNNHTEQLVPRMASILGPGTVTKVTGQP